MYCGEEGGVLKRGPLGWHHDKCFRDVSISVRNVLRSDREIYSPRKEKEMSGHSKPKKEMSEEEKLEQELTKVIDENLNFVEELESLKEDKSLIIDMTFWQRVKFLFLGKKYLNRMIINKRLVVYKKKHSNDEKITEQKRVWTDNRTEELRKRMDSNGVLKLTMADIYESVYFEEARVKDIRGSMFAGFEAVKIILTHEGKTRVLKDQTPKSSAPTLMKN
jgi:hypothetical protein